MMTVALLLGLGAAQAQGDGRYTNLAVLDDGRSICYSADVVISGKNSAALEKKANDRLKLLFQGVGLKASHMDEAADCEHFIALGLEVDNATPPGLYSGALNVYTTGVSTEDMDLTLPSIYERSFWGAKGTVYTAAQLDSILDKVLTEAFADFKKDIARARTELR